MKLVGKVKGFQRWISLKAQSASGFVFNFAVTRRRRAQRVCLLLFHFQLRFLKVKNNIPLGNKHISPQRHRGHRDYFNVKGGKGKETTW